MILNRQPFIVFTEGESVYVQDFPASKQKWIPGTIQRATHPVPYIVMLSDDSTVTRYFDNIKARHTKNTSDQEKCQLYSSFQPLSSEHTVIQLVATTDDPAGPELFILTRPSRNR